MARCATDQQLDPVWQRDRVQHRRPRRDALDRLLALGEIGNAGIAEIILKLAFLQVLDRIACFADQRRRLCRLSRGLRRYGAVRRFPAKGFHLGAVANVNAAMNVLAQGRWDNSNACGAQVRPAPVPAPRGEAGIRPNAACPTRSVEGISVL